MQRTRSIVWTLALVLSAGAALAQESRPMSPSGSAATQVGGKWEKTGEDSRYTGGKWVVIDYSRPILRGRQSVFGSGADYGKKVLDGGPLWRVGANKTTRLTTEAALEIGGKRLEPGTYSLFVDLKENAWTLVVSKQAIQEKYDREEKAATWGAYNYDAKQDVARAPMKSVKAPHSIDQLTIGFLDMTDKGGEIAIGWGKDVGVVHFTVAK